MAGFTTRPVIMGTHGVVAAGHYLAAQAGLRMLEEGGNAVDAGVAAGFALAVLPFAVNGNGAAPAAATLDKFRELGIEMIPGDGFLPAVVPAAVDSYITALAMFGTMPLSEVIAPALELARDGFAVYPRLHEAMNKNLARWQERYPSTLAVFAPGGHVPAVGEILRQPDWANTFEALVAAERKAARRGRTAALRAARDVFYRGEIAREIVKFARSTEVMDASGKAHAALLTEEDFAAYSARVENPVSADYRGLTVHKCNTWCQGPVFLQQLRLLEGFDLAEMGHNTPEFIHTVIECAKLAFADREAYYGDPQFVEVPLDRLLSREYADERRRLLDPERASLEERPGGGGPSRMRRVPAADGGPDVWPTMDCGDTTQLDVVDRYGNMISITPSGGWFATSPVIPGLGFPLGTRGQMFVLEDGHPNCPEPGKRPRSRGWSSAPQAGTARTSGPFSSSSTTWTTAWTCRRR